MRDYSNDEDQELKKRPMSRMDFKVRLNVTIRNPYIFKGDSCQSVRGIIRTLDSSAESSKIYEARRVLTKS